MVICGIKLTHDAAIAIMENGVLKCNIEIEKICNNQRYSSIDDVSVIPEILKDNGYDISAIDHFVIDGWLGTGPFWNGPSFLDLRNEGKDIRIQVAPYNETAIEEDIFTRLYFENKLPIGDQKYAYSSFMHGAGHISSAYCTSPFAEKGQSAYILTWDGGQYPRLYFFDALTSKVQNLGHLFVFLGTIYSIFPQYFGPYKKSEEELKKDKEKKTIEGFFGGYSVAGKIMSYIALGKVRPELFGIFSEIYEKYMQTSNEFEHIFSKRARQIIDLENYSDEDVLATLHAYLENLLILKLKEKIEKYPFAENNLCFSGGCALNIKWNSAIRSSGIFNEVYIPPFANDSGSSIGAACNEYLYRTNRSVIKWNVYSGPMIKSNGSFPGWSQSPCSLKELAFLLHVSNEPVVFLNDAAELGPRALGNRSIIAQATSEKMKDLLNRVKRREPFRPVAPLCLEEDAPGIFDPGCQDPYMLFDHKVREEWKAALPAICHIDGTARLQTVNRMNNSVVFDLLQEYKKMSGFPLLCNTSANFNGSGFFPDVYSATRWGQLNYVWSNNLLFTKEVKVDLNLDI